MTQLLNADLVQRELNKKGVKRGWLAGFLGISKTAAYVMVRTGVMPETKETQERVVKALSEFLGVKPKDILISERRKTA